MTRLWQAKLPTHEERLAAQVAGAPEGIRDLVRALNGGGQNRQRPMFAVRVEGPLSPTEAMFMLRGIDQLAVDLGGDHDGKGGIRWDTMEEAFAKLVGGVFWPDEHWERA